MKALIIIYRLLIDINVGSITSKKYYVKECHFDRNYEQNSDDIYKPIMNERISLVVRKQCAQY